MSDVVGATGNFADLIVRNTTRLSGVVTEALTLTVTGALTASSTLAVTGTATMHNINMTGTLAVTGNITATTSIAATTSVSATTTITAGTGFGCNGSAAQTAYASGGALAAYAGGVFGYDSDAHNNAAYTLLVNIRAALVANGIMS